MPPGRLVATRPAGAAPHPACTTPRDDAPQRMRRAEFMRGATRGDKSFKPPYLSSPGLTGRSSNPETQCVRERVYYVYILASRIGGTLYVGVTSDLVRRVYIQKEKLLAGFTKEHNVVRLVYFRAIRRNRCRDSAREVTEEVAARLEVHHLLPLFGLCARAISRLISAFSRTCVPDFGGRCQRYPALPP